MRALFGPGGNSEIFKEQGYKSTIQAPEWVKNFGLDAYEYEAGKGVNAKDETLIEIGNQAKINNIRMSVHAPYFISLSSVEEQKRLNSANYILQSARAVKMLNGNHIVIHAGSAGKIDRKEATRLAMKSLEHALQILQDNGLYGVSLGIETMGKINQLGTFDEVIEICSVDKTVVPTVDFGHINARNLGGYFTTVDDYKRIFQEISEKVSPEAANNLHCHFSKIEYTQGGEYKHLTFDDNKFGPDYEPLMQAIIDLGAAPTIICESDGTMAEDALLMKKEYLRILGEETDE